MQAQNHDLFLIKTLVYIIKVYNGNIAKMVMINKTVDSAKGRSAIENRN